MNMNELTPVKFNEEIVITTKTLAQVYECKEQQITQNFNNSQDKFEEKKHYYKLQGKELKEFKRVIENFDNPLYQEIKFASVLILWTKSETKFSFELQVEYQSRKIGRD